MVDDIISIKSADVVFTVGTSGTIPPDDNGWKTLFSELVLTTDGYVWTCTKIVKTDNSVEYSGKHCLGKCSDFADVIELYALGDNNVTPPDSGWKQSYSPVKGKWLWTKNELHFQNSSQVMTTDPICIGYFAKDGNNGTSFNLRGTAIAHYSSFSELKKTGSFQSMGYYLLDKSSDADNTANDSYNEPCIAVYMEAPDYDWYIYSANIGDAYRVETDLWVYTKDRWVNMGSIQGPQGEEGKGAMWAVLTKGQVIFEADADGSIPKTSKSTMIRVFVGSELIEPSKYNIAISNAENYDASKASLTKSDYSTTLSLDSSGITIKNTGENINSASPYSSIRLTVTYGDYSLFINVNIVVDDSKHITEISLTVTSLHNTLDTYERAGILTRANYASLFAEYKDAGEVVSKAEVNTAIEDGISKATINADQVNINANHMLNITGNYITVDATNFKLDRSGNVSMAGEVNATSGTIGGFEISTGRIGYEIGSDFAYSSKAEMSLQSDCIIFNGNKRQAVLGQTSILGNPYLLSLKDDVIDYTPKTGIYVGVRGSMSGNDAISIGGGYISGASFKTDVFAFKYYTQANAPTRQDVYLDRSINALFVSTRCYWRAKSSDDYRTINVDVYIHLPDMNDYDDGHILFIKRGADDAGNVYVIPGSGKEYVNDSGWQKSYSNWINCYNNKSYTSLYDNLLNIAYEGSAMMFMYFKSLQIQMNNLPYQGCWVQWNNPR